MKERKTKIRWRNNRKKERKKETFSREWTVLENFESFNKTSHKRRTKGRLVRYRV